MNNKALDHAILQTHLIIYGVCCYLFSDLLLFVSRSICTHLDCTVFEISKAICQFGI